MSATTRATVAGAPSAARAARAGRWGGGRGAGDRGAGGGAHATSRSSRSSRRWTRVATSTTRKNRTVMADARPTLLASKAVVTAWYMTVVVDSCGPPWVMM